MIDNDHKIEIAIVTSQNKDLWRKCELLEYETFLKAGYIEPTPEHKITEYNEYSEEMIAAFISKRGKSTNEKILIGVSRLTTALKKDKMDFGLFPTIDSYQELGISKYRLDKLMTLNPKKVADITSIAAHPQYREYKAPKFILKRVITRAWELGVRYGVAAIDNDVFLKLQKKYQCYALGPPKMYWGSYTTPTFIDSYDFLKGFKKALIHGYRCKGLLNGYTQGKLH